MYHIFVDFEMTCWNKGEILSEKQIPEIIDIGAVKLDENFNIIDTFSTFVKPQYITFLPKKCVKLTGITQSDISDAPVLHEALAEFEKWVGSKDVKFYAWGDNDKIQLYNECIEKDIYKEIPQLYKKWRNFQNIFMRVYGFNRRMKLIEAIEMVGMEFEGQQHRAVYDAINSSRLLSLMKHEEEHEKCKEMFKKYYNKQEEITVKLGDLFASKLMNMNFA